MTKSAFTLALSLLEEALGLLRSADPLTWLIYTAGTVPFFAVLFFEITDLVQNPFAAERLLGIAFLLALLYISLHVCQSVFSIRIYNKLTKQESKLATQFRDALASQSVLAGSKLLFWPVALVLVIPHPVVTMFYQHSLLVPDEHNRRNWRDTIAEAKKDAAYRQWPVIWMLVIVLLIRILLAINLLSLLLVLPLLWKIFSGMEGMITRAPEALLNPASLAAICALAYLGLDPLVKAACVLRRFERQSEISGRDLRLRLSNFRRTVAAAMVSVALFCLPAHAKAAERARHESSSPSPRQMQQAIRGVFHDPANIWDLPVVETRKRPAGALESFAQTIIDRLKEGWESVTGALQRFAEWVRRLFSSSDKARPVPQRGASKTGASIVIGCFSALLVIAVVLLRWGRPRRQPPKTAVVAAAAQPGTIDLLAEDLQADEQNEDEWLTQARRYRMAGDFRSALRALYLGNLATLARSGMISLARGKSNLDYSRELHRRAKRLGPDLGVLFGLNVQLFERSWYGSHLATEETLDCFLENFSALQKFM